jgi:CHAT domain-containing protein/tetratricopeptide (TPR) repeat protein
MPQTHSPLRLILHSTFLRGLLAAWLLLVPSAAAAQDAAPKPDEEMVLIRQYLLDGQQREKDGLIDAAIDSYRKALDLSEKKYPEAFATGLILEHLGMASLNKGDPQEAQRHLLRAVKILDKNVKEIQAAGGEQAASPFAKAVAAIYAKAVYDLVIVYQGIKNGAARDADGAIDQFRKAVELAEKNLGPDDLVTGFGLEYLGAAYLNKGDRQEAEPHLLRAVKILYEYQKGLRMQATPEQASLLAVKHAKAVTGLASVYIIEGTKRGAAGDFDGAIALHRKAVELAEKNLGPDDSLTGLSLDHLGAAYLDKGDYKEAERHLLRAVKILGAILKEAPQGSSDPDAAAYANGAATQHAKAVHDLAVVYDYLGDYSRAEPLYGQALAAREKVLGPDHVSVAESLNFLANLYLAKADYARAAQMFQRALAINEKKFDPKDPRVTTLLNNLAYAYESQGDVAQAEELYKEAIARAEERPNPDGYPSTATYLNNLGTLYILKNPARARPLLDRALAIREKLYGPDEPLVAVTLNNLARLDWHEGELKRAERLFLRALDIQQRASGPAHPDVASTLSNLAWLYVTMGETKRGINLLSEGSKHSERNLLLKLATGSEEQKRIYTASIQEGTSGNVSLHLQKAPDDEQAARLALSTILWRKGRVLDVMSGQVAAVLGSQDGESRATIAKLTATRGQLSALVWKGTEGDETRYREKVGALESEIQGLEKLIGEKAVAAGAGPGSVTVEAVQAAIPEGAALVEVVQYRPATFGSLSDNEWGQPRYVAYVLKRAGAPAAVELGDAAKIDAAVSRLRAALRDPRGDDPRPLARAVDDAVMRPVRKLLGEVRQVLISPDGALNLLPYAALVDEQNHYLVESYTFTYLNSGRDLLRMREGVASKQSPVVIANPLFDNAEAGSQPAPAAKPDARGAATGATSLGMKFTPLGGTLDESRGVSGILRGARTFIGAQATEAAVKQVKAPSILHIATHGFFFSKAAERSPAPGAGRAPATASGSRMRMAENPLLRSGIALAGANNLDGGQGEDGILTALEAAALDLRGTELVVLSACETGVGEVQSGEGVYGMRRALVLAGAESQLMSLWKVNDDATSDLMVGFYKKLVAGEGRSESLRQVQLKLLRSEELSHPFFWAGFIMSGQWGPL